MNEIISNFFIPDFFERILSDNFKLDIGFNLIKPFLPLIIAIIMLKLPTKYKFYTKLTGHALLIIYSSLNIYWLLFVKNLEDVVKNPILVIWGIISFIILLASIRGLKNAIKDIIKFYRIQKEKTIGIFGTRAVGKTTYVATLAEIIWGSKARPNWKLEVPRGLGYIRDVIKNLKRGEWPAGTPPGTKQEIELRITEKNGFRSKYHRLYMNDISGEEFERFIKVLGDNPGFSDLPDSLATINKCQGFLILIDPARANEESYDYHALIQYLIEMKELKRKEKLEELFAFIFTKNDEHNISDPEKFAKENMKPLYHAYSLRMYRDRARFFTCSSVGSVDINTKKPKLPLEPIGIEEPLEWLILNLKKVRITPPSERVKVTIEEKEGEVEEEKEEEIVEETEGKMRCSECGSLVDVDAEKCPECGSTIFEEVK